MSEGKAQQDKLDKLEAEMNDLLAQVDDVVEDMARTLSDDCEASGEAVSKAESRKRIAPDAIRMPQTEPVDEASGESAEPHTPDHRSGVGMSDTSTSPMDEALAGALASLGLDETLPADMSDMPSGMVVELNAEQLAAEIAEEAAAKSSSSAHNRSPPTTTSAQTRADPGFGSLTDLDDLDSELAKLADDLIVKANAEADRYRTGEGEGEDPPSVLESAAAYVDPSSGASWDTDAADDDADTGSRAERDDRDVSNSRDDRDNQPPPRHDDRGVRGAAAHDPASNVRSSKVKPKTTAKPNARSAPKAQRGRAQQVASDAWAALLHAMRWLLARVGPAGLTALVLINKPLAKRPASFRHGIALVASFNVLLACTVAIWATFFRASTMPVVTVSYPPKTLQGTDTPPPVADMTMTTNAG